MKIKKIVKTSVHADVMTMIHFSHCAHSESYENDVILRLNGRWVMFFHNDSPQSRNGVNDKKIAYCKKLIRLHRIDKFICCYPDHTGISKRYQFIKGHGQCHVSFNNDAGYFDIWYDNKE